MTGKGETRKGRQGRQGRRVRGRGGGSWHTLRREERRALGAKEVEVTETKWDVE